MKRKKIINGILLCSTILALCVPGISISKKDVVVESIWTATPVNIDGSNDDWQGDNLAFFKKNKVEYAFRNDSENLYVLFIIRDQKFLSTINFTGMTIWLNTKGEEKKNYGVKFQIKTVTADNYISLIEGMGMTVPEAKKTEIRKKPTYRVYHNEVIDKEGEASLIEPTITGPVWNFGGKKEVTYEFRVPLMRGEGQPVGIGTEPGESIKVGFEWGGLTDELKKQRLAQQIEGGTAGRAQQGTGNFGKGERGAGTAMGSQGLGNWSRIRATKYSFWTDVKLAQK